MNQKIEIIKETADFIAVNKPAGLLTHKDGKSEAETLADIIVKLYPEIKNAGDPRRPGIAHRLDRETSGIIIIARTKKMHDHLKQAFKNRTVKKEYLVIVRGRMPKDEGEIKFRLARSRRGSRMAGRPENQEGRESVTRYEVIKRLPNATVLRAFPETGRTHQIRAHFHALGHPVVGDPLYRIKGKNKPEKTRRLMLHASKISFTDTKGREQTFSAPLPPEFEV